MWLFLWKPGEFQLLGASGSPLCRGFCPRPKRSYGAKAPLTMWGAWSCPASILCGQDKKQAVESTPLGVRGPQCSVQRSLRVAAKAAPLNSLAHWATGASFFVGKEACGLFQGPHSFLCKAPKQIGKRYICFFSEFTLPSNIYGKLSEIPSRKRRSMVKILSLLLCLCA